MSVVNFIVGDVDSNVAPRGRSGVDGIVEDVEELELETGVFVVSLSETEAIVGEVLLSVELGETGKILSGIQGAHLDSVELAEDLFALVEGAEVGGLS